MASGWYLAYSLYSLYISHVNIAVVLQVPSMAKNGYLLLGVQPAASSGSPSSSVGTPIQSNSDPSTC